MHKVQHSTIVEVNFIKDTFFEEYVVPFIGKITNNPDYFELKTESKQSIGIKETKELINWLQLKPFQAKYKVALVLNADKLTLDAQNSLLKTLEEPPKSSLIFLVTSNHKRLIPTILSRSELVRLKQEDPSKNSLTIESIQKLVTAKVSIKFKWIDKIYEIKSPIERKAKIETFLQGLYLYTKGRDNIEEKIINLKLIEKTFEGLRRNVNIKLLLENLLLNYKY